MGGLFSHAESPVRPTRKRKINLDAEDEIKSLVVKRIHSTYEHVYQELFCKGEGSDITIRALDRDWALHRIYLKQSPFFAALLDGGWKESNKEWIRIDLLDENITRESLHVIFGSFYHDNIPLSNKTVVGVLAAATWFQMDEIRRLCSSFLCRRVRLELLILLHSLAAKYNLPELNQSCVKWLARRLTILPDCPVVFELMKIIPISLMQSVVDYPQLIVVQFEEDLFSSLLKWLYLKQNPDKSYCPSAQLLLDAYKYFAREAVGFLDSPQGAIYSPVFRSVRWEHVISHLRSACQLLRDGIVPQPWVQTAYQRQWILQLRCHSLYPAANVTTAAADLQHNPLPQHSTPLASTNAGSSTAVVDASREHSVNGSQSDLITEVFWRRCERFGRHISDSETACTWRWSGYHFGVDLLFKYRRRAFHVIRPTDATLSEGLVCTSRKHDVKIFLTVISVANEEYSSSPSTTALSVDGADTLSTSSLGALDVLNVAGVDCYTCDDGMCVRSWVCSTELKTLQMLENMTYELLRLPEDFPFPVVVSANILRYDTSIF